MLLDRHSKHLFSVQMISRNEKQSSYWSFNPACFSPDRRLQESGSVSFHQLQTISLRSRIKY